MLCMTCGHQSADGASMCGNCGAPLRSGHDAGRNKEPLGAPPPYNKSLYTIIASQISLFDAGRLTLEAVDKELAQYEEYYKEKTEAVRAMDIPADLRDTFDEEYRCGLSGTEGMYEAMGTLRRYLQSGDTALRDRGLAGIDSSLHLVNTALRMNWDSANVLAQSIQDIIDQHEGKAPDPGENFAFGGGFALADGMNLAGF